jgi:hypothetical protein
MVVDALKAVGAARSIVIDEHDVVLAGNGVSDAAVDAGIENVRIVDAEGDELIAVRRSNLTDEQKRALALFDNRAAELATWDVDALAGDAKDGFDLAPYFSTDELHKLGVLVPTFVASPEDEQGRLDQKAPVTCPKCGHVFTP